MISQKNYRDVFKQIRNLRKYLLDRKGEYMQLTDSNLAYMKAENMNGAMIQDVFN